MLKYISLLSRLHTFHETITLLSSSLYPTSSAKLKGYFASVSEFAFNKNTISSSLCDLSSNSISLANPC